MLRLALGGTVAFAAILTVVAWVQTTSTAQSGIQPATPGTTFLGTLPAQSGPAITGATTSSPTTNVNGTTGSTTGTNTTTSTTLGDIALEAAVPVTVDYPATPMAQPQVAGAPVMLAQPTNGMVPTTGGQYVAMPVAGNQRPVGTAGTLPSGATRAAAAPVPSVARVADSDLLRAAQSRLRGVAGFADGRVSVDVQRGIIMVRTRNLSSAERDRVFTSVRDVRGAIGVFVK